MKTNDIATALEIELGRARFGQPDKIPAGFRTCVEWAKLWKCGQTQARDGIRKHVSSGRMEMKAFNIARSDGRINKTPHYRAVR